MSKISSPFPIIREENQSSNDYKLLKQMTQRFKSDIQDDTSDDLIDRNEMQKESHMYNTEMNNLYNLSHLHKSIVSN